jgi:hypothetical protein
VDQIQLTLGHISNNLKGWGLTYQEESIEGKKEEILKQIHKIYACETAREIDANLTKKKTGA